jgi:tRNA(adenine34) deaminase
MSIYNNKYIEEAYIQAKLSDQNGEVPIGAVLVSPDEKIIIKTHNLTIKNSDPTAHAEIIAIREACKIMSEQRLEGWSLYVSLEPCPMCAQAISFARIKNLYFSAYDEKGGGVEHNAKIFNQKSCFFRPNIYGGLNQNPPAKLLGDFFERKRK